MFEIENIKIKRALLLAPMEDVTGIGFRKLCKEFGADVVYTEFVNSDGLIRNNKKTQNKLKIRDDERPIGIQIYGADIDSMVGAAKIAEEEKPELIDINAGCWVKKVARRGAGAGLLKDPPYMQQMVEAIVKTVKLPVTVKTRIGWDDDSIMIVDVAKRMEDVGAKAITIHCRTREQGHSGSADWSWIPEVKNAVNIPVVLNGGVFTADDVKTAFEETNADAVMIARGAIENPWIFREAKYLLDKGNLPPEITVEERIHTALRHLKYEIEYKDEERRAVIPFRKYYSGYLKGMHHASRIRQELMKYDEYKPIEDILLNYLTELENYQDTHASTEE
ncbi:MAG: tRNA dihydrouridine synthase DusB, partial [Melioribacteraceae bacterium]|nr:tRNA dihydrouridine synthase DusB [Melioribacteraceae bacterium]